MPIIGSVLYVHKVKFMFVTGMVAGWSTKISRLYVCDQDKALPLV